MERQRMGILVCFFEASSVPVVAMVANLSDSQADKTAVDYRGLVPCLSRNLP